MPFARRSVTPCLCSLGGGNAITSCLNFRSATQLSHEILHTKPVPVVLGAAAPPRPLSRALPLPVLSSSSAVEGSPVPRAGEGVELGVLSADVFPEGVVLPEPPWVTEQRLLLLLLLVRSTGLVPLPSRRRGSIWNDIRGQRFGPNQCMSM